METIGTCKGKGYVKKDGTRVGERGRGRGRCSVEGACGQGDREGQVELSIGDWNGQGGQRRECAVPFNSNSGRCLLHLPHPISFLTSPSPKTRRNAINVRPKSTDGLFSAVIDSFCHYEYRYYPARWPSGLRRQTKDLVSSGAWVRIPLSSVLSTPFFFFPFHETVQKFRALTVQHYPQHESIFSSSFTEFPRLQTDSIYYTIKH